MRSPWPITRGCWPWTSIRGCAGGSAGTPRSTRSPTASWRSGRGPRRSRSPRAPGSTSTRIAGPIGDRRARALEDYAPARRSGQSIIDRVPGGAIKLSPAADFARHFRRLRMRDRADQPPRRVQGGDGLVRRAGRVPSAGDPAARVRHLDRPRRRSTPSRPGSPRSPTGSSTPTRR